MDNPKLYTRLLHKFKDSQSGFAELFTQALADPDTTAPARTAHTLKGTAGNIGARSVQAAAAELEQACLAGADTQALQPLLQKCVESLAPVVAGLRAFAGESAVPSELPHSPDPEVVEPALHAQLDRLEALLQDSDADATDLLVSILEHAPAGRLGTGLKRVAQAVEAFDFDAAVAALQQARG